MAELELFENPHRRRSRKRRYMTRLQKHYFGGGRKRRHHRNDPGPRRAYHHRRRHRRNGPLYMAHQSNPRRRHRNPALLGGLTRTVTTLFGDVLAGSIGIQANNLVGNAVAEKVLKVTSTKRSLTKVATAVLLPALGAMFFRKYARLLSIGGAAAISLEVTKALNKHVYPSMGEMGNLLSVADSPNVVTAGSYPAGLPVVLNANIRPGLGANIRPGLGAPVMPMGEYNGLYEEAPGVY